ncbi:MAG: DNA polymerase III subunit gamma/tau C-terminal domain-containing protein, partial [Gammaproteobacteria bacterium]
FRPAAAPPPGRPVVAARAPEVPASPKKTEPAGPQPAGVEALPRSPGQISPENWADLVAVLDLSGMARSVAMHAVPGAVGSDSLELVIDPSHASLQGASAAERLSLALAAHFGRDIALGFREAAPGSETPAAREARIAEEQRLAALQRLEADPNVRVLLEDFGGQLHRERVKVLADAAATGGNGR